MDAFVKAIGSLSSGCLAALTVQSIMLGDYGFTIILAFCTLMLIVVTLSLD